METIPHDLEKAAASFFPDGCTVTMLGSSSGYSGSRFAQVQDVNGSQWCLRRWPHETPEARLHFIHRALRYSRSQGFDGVPALKSTPDGATVIQQGGAFYDAQAWVSGETPGRKRQFGQTSPNVGCHLDTVRLTALVGALAAFHQSTVGIHPQEAANACSLVAQFEQLAQAFKAFGDRVPSQESQSDLHRTPLVGKWLEYLPHLLTLAETCIESHQQAAQDTSTLCHGDLWPQHVFSDGERFTGFTDFESLCFSSPTVDLAQLILHFQGWHVCQSVVETYQSGRPLGREEIALLPAAAALDLLAEGSWAIEALSLSEATHPQRPAHHQNLQMLFPSVELLLRQAGM